MNLTAGVCVRLHSTFQESMHCVWITHLVYFGQRACALPVSIIVSPQWTPVPQGTFLLQSIIQNVILLTPLPLKSIEVHGGLHGRVVFKAPLCSAAAALQWNLWPSLAVQPKEKCVKAEIHVIWWLRWTCVCITKSHTLNFLFTSLKLPFSCFLRRPVL